MRVLVIGGGVVGVTTAYYLARDGVEVTLVEKEAELATLASAGNAGLIAPGHAFAWASPSAPMELWHSLTGEETALRVNPLKAPGMLSWGIRFLRECTAERARKNTLVKFRLARYSQQSLDRLAAEEGIDYHDVHHGCLYVYRDQAKFAAGIDQMKLLLDVPTQGEPHYAQALPAAMLKDKQVKYYSLQANAHPWVTRAESEGGISRTGRAVHVKMIAIRGPLLSPSDDRLTRA